jgi:DNA-binding LytR/AlgR family response regulator
VVRKLNFQTVPLADLPLKGRTQPGSSRRPIVLIVDDEAVIADTRAMILELSGISAMVAYDGKSALEIAHTAPPDLLLTDVAMPGMNGVDLATAIRQSFPQLRYLAFFRTGPERGFAERSPGSGTGIYHPYQTPPSDGIAGANFRSSELSEPR